MTLSDQVNGVVDAVIARINANKAQVGNPISVTERYEPPAVYAEMPCIYVVPLVDGDDTMICHLDGSNEMDHQFPITVMGFYDRPSIDGSYLREIRGYGYNLIELFDNLHRGVGRGYITRFRLGQGNFEVSDRVILSYKIVLNIKAILG